MKAIKRQVLTFLNDYNGAISIAGAVLSYGITTHFSLQLSHYYAVITGCLAFSVYALQRLVDSPQFILTGRSFFLFFLSCVSFIISVILLLHVFRWNWITFFSGICFCLVCLWYAIPLFWGIKLREVASIKILVIALTWSYTCAFFPLFNEQIFLGKILVLFVLIAVYFVAITVPFDIRDMHVDPFSQQTIPQLIGEKLAKIVGVFLLLVVYIAHLTLKICTWNNPLFHLAFWVQIMLIFSTHERKSKWHFIWIDLSIIFLGGAYVLG